MEAGQDPALFWRLSLREIAVIMDGTVSRFRILHNELAWAAWHTAMIGMVKKPPKLRDMFIGEERPIMRRQTPEEMEAILRSWMATRKH